MKFNLETLFFLKLILKQNKTKLYYYIFDIYTYFLKITKICRVNFDNCLNSKIKTKFQNKKFNFKTYKFTTKN